MEVFYYYLKEIVYKGKIKRCTRNKKKRDRGRKVLYTCSEQSLSVYSGKEGGKNKKAIHTCYEEKKMSLDEVGSIK